MGLKEELKQEYVWCLHCERVYTRLEWYQRGGSCPTKGCSGFSLGDGWHWERIRHGREDRYPEHPVSGTLYPMYDP